VEVEFGRNGKPFFASGPDDNAEMIIKHLTAKLGEGNFDYLIAVNEADLMILDELDKPTASLKRNLHKVIGR
jgi:hypothetical protein